MKLNNDGDDAAHQIKEGVSGRKNGRERWGPGGSVGCFLPAVSHLRCCRRTPQLRGDGGGGEAAIIKAEVLLLPCVFPDTDGRVAARSLASTIQPELLRVFRVQATMPPGL